MTVSESMADSGPLLEACMGAGATLVAIIGGLLVTRYITIESELQAANDRLLGAQARLTEASDDLSAAEANLLGYQIAEALDQEEVIGELIEVAAAGRAVEVAAIRDLTDLGAFTDAQVRPVLEAWLAETKKAREHSDLWESIPVEQDLPHWTEFKRGRQIPIAIEPVWAGFYDLVASVREEEASKRSDSHFSPFSHRLIGPISDRQHEHRLIRLVDEARAAADQQRVETAASREARSRISRPPGLVGGLVVLALLTIATVVIPVLFLVPTPATLSYRSGVAIVSIFLAAILLLFGYMFWHVGRLRTLSSTQAVDPDDGAGDP